MSDFSSDDTKWGRNSFVYSNDILWSMTEKMQAYVPLRRMPLTVRYYPQPLNITGVLKNEFFNTPELLRGSEKLFRIVEEGSQGVLAYVGSLLRR